MIYSFSQKKFQNLPFKTQSSKFAALLKVYLLENNAETKKFYLSEYHLYLSWIEKTRLPIQIQAMSYEDLYHFWVHQSGHFRGLLPLRNQTDFLTPKKETISWSVLLDRFRSGHNTGSVFRTAECFQFASVLSLGYTPKPDSTSVKSVAMGTENWIPHKHFDSLDDFLCQEKKTTLIGLEITPNSIPLNDWKPTSSGVLVLGNEERGLSKQTLSQCQKVIHIPMYGRKKSLNVANAFAITACYIRQHLDA